MDSFNRDFSSKSENIDDELEEMIWLEEEAKEKKAAQERKAKENREKQRLEHQKQSKIITDDVYNPEPKRNRSLSGTKRVTEPTKETTFEPKIQDDKNTQW